MATLFNGHPFCVTLPALPPLSRGSAGGTAVKRGARPALMLNPGVNEVDAEYAERIVKHPSFKALGLALGVGTTPAAEPDALPPVPDAAVETVTEVVEVSSESEAFADAFNDAEEEAPKGKGKSKKK